MGNGYLLHSHQAKYTVAEHTSNTIPWLGIEKLGVEIRFAPSQDGCVKIEDVEALIDNRTRIVSTASSPAWFVLICTSSHFTAVTSSLRRGG